MSTTPAPRSLFDRLVDDAAVFPPGNAPVEVAWVEHLRLRSGPFGDVVGPLLIGAPGARALAGVAAASPPGRDTETAGTAHPGRVEVGVIARPGTPVADLVQAVDVLRGSPVLRVASVELAHDDAGDWRRALGLGVPVAVEVPRDGAVHHAALDEVAAAADGGPVEVLAKLRTQSTPAAPVPTPRELAEFLTAARERALPLKLTGGLHHVVAHDEPVAGGGSEPQHGLLNVLVAVHHLEGGATLRDLEATLALRDAAALAALVRGLDERAVARLRARFRSFGCCGVLDPVGELVDLGLLAP